MRGEPTKPEETHMRTRAVSSSSQAGVRLPHSKDSKGVYLEDLRDPSDVVGRRPGAS